MPWIQINGNDSTISYVDRMKKKLPPAKSPLPKFGSDKEASEYFGSHSIADVWDQLPAAPRARPSAALAKSIRERGASAKSPISIRLVPEQISSAMQTSTVNFYVN